MRRNMSDAALGLLGPPAFLLEREPEPNFVTLEEGGGLYGPYFERFGSEEQRERFLPRCVSGEHILAVAMTEPGAGSDPGRSTLTRKHPGSYRATSPGPCPVRARG